MRINAIPLITALLMMCTSVVFGQVDKGVISGKIVEKKGDKVEAVPFANVIIAGTNNGASSDFDGLFKIVVDPGTYNVVVSSMGYHTDTVKVTVVADQETDITIPIQSTAIVVTGIDVVAQANDESDDVQLMERMDAVGIEQTMGAEELSATGSSDVASGLTKVAGLSVVGSKHIFVRGMGDRYNSAYLNGMPIASPDPDKRVIPLDIFPSNVVSSLSVKKAFTSDLYGDFSGGAIDIRTKDYPDEPTLNISIGGGYNTQSTFKDFKTYNGGKKDFWGVDDGSRDIPLDILADDNYSSLQALEAGRNISFKQNLSPIRKTALPNNSVNIYAGNFFKMEKLSPNTGIGVLFVASHGTDHSFQEGKYRIINTQGDVQLDYDFQKWSFNTNSSVLGNVLFQINDRHSITYNTLWVNLSSDNTLETDGSHFDYEKDIYSRRYTYLQSSLFVHQISGKHNFMKDDKLQINWAMAMNTAASKEPDRRQLVWLYDEEGMYTVNAIDRLDNHRFFSELDEEETTRKAEVVYHLKQKLDEDDNVVPVISIKAGYQDRDKTRTFDYRQFVFDMTDVDEFYTEGVDPQDPDSYINNQTHVDGVFNVVEVPNPASANLAGLMVKAGYLSADINIGEKISIHPGVRVEQGQQYIRFRDQQQPIFLQIENLEATNVLPSLIARYSLNETNIIRFSASQTVSRPGFKEVAPFEYTEFFAGVKSRGNPELINGMNYNVDLRYEIYPRRGELIAVSAFGKYLENPIERTMLSTASGQLQSFQNAESAYVAGLELEARKNLDSLFAGTRILRDLSVGVNMSYIYSEVNLDTAGNSVSTVQTNSSRALQGASPYLVNVDVRYEKWMTEDVKTSVSLAYNLYGKRISNVGIYGLGDMYEMPVNTLNLILSAEVKDKWQFGLSAKNILNPEIRTTQSTSEGTETLNSYRRGATIGFSVTYKFL